MGKRMVSPTSSPFIPCNSKPPYERDILSLLSHVKEGVSEDGGDPEEGAGLGGISQP
jgi:hypothetical protein